MAFVKKISESVRRLKENDDVRAFFSVRANGVFYRMTLAFGFFFLGPLFGFAYIGVKSHLFGTNELLYCFLGVLVFSLFGYIILKQISDGIATIERQMAQKKIGEGLIGSMGENELGNIAMIADSMDQHLRVTSEALTRRMQEINALRELGNIPVFQLSAKTLIDFALEKAMLITGAVGGASFFLLRKDGSSIVTCQHTRGEGIICSPGKRLPLQDFLAGAVFNEQGAQVLLKESKEKWDRLFDAGIGSVAAIPLDLGSSRPGLALLVKREGRIWDENGLGFLTTFFSTTGSMLKMQELGIKERETTGELKSVLSIIRIITSDLKETDLLTAISRRLCEVFPSQWVGLALIDEATSQLKLMHTFHQSHNGGRTGLLLDKDSSLLYSAIDASELVLVEDVAKQKPFFETPLFMDIGLKSCMIKRLDVNGKAIGAICLGSDSPRAFGRKDKRMFTMATAGIALAIEQTRLLAKERAKSRELEVLNKISMALSSSTFDMDRVLNYILELITGLIRVEAGAIMLVQNDILTFNATTGTIRKNFDGLRIRIGQEGVSGWVAATGEAIIVQNVEDNPQFCADIDDRTGFKTKNLLCVPMISNGRVTGVIELLNKKGGTFNDEDLRAIKSVASSAAIALENFRLFGESSHLAQKERLIRTIFQKYVPEEIVNDILKKGESAQLTIGERKIVTVFNVDIRGYSAMSKQAATEDVVGVLNYFFMRMGNIILKHKGVLDKYLGDGLLAIFGAPISTRNPALDATLAAIEMIEGVEAVSKVSQERCGVPLKIGVSINTGEAIVGNIGFDKKMEYTVIGDVVNETFRLQDLTRRKTNSILISDSTYQQVKYFVHANQWRVKKFADREGVMDIYEVMGKKELLDHEPLSPEIPDETVDARSIH